MYFYCPPSFFFIIPLPIFSTRKQISMYFYWKQRLNKRIVHIDQPKRHRTKPSKDIKSAIPNAAKNHTIDAANPEILSTPVIWISIVKAFSQLHGISQADGTGSAFNNFFTTVVEGFFFFFSGNKVLL